MKKVRFDGNNHYRSGRKLDNGEILEISEREYTRFSYKFVDLDDASDSVTAEADSSTDSEEAASDDERGNEDSDADADDGDSTESVDESEEDALEGTVGELKERLASGEFDDQLDDLEIRERQKDDPRKTALDAIADRKTETN